MRSSVCKAIAIIMASAVFFGAFLMAGAMQEEGQDDKDASFDPGRLTQIVTALLAIENLPADDVLVMDTEVYNVTGNQIFLQVGEEITVSDLLYAMLLSGAEDPAIAFAKAVSGSVAEFVVLMGEKAAMLGCTETTFTNPRGLKAAGQETTIHDFAMIAQAAMKNEIISGYAKKPVHTIAATNRSHERIIENDFFIINELEKYAAFAPEEPEEDNVIEPVAEPEPEQEGLAEPQAQEKERPGFSFYIKVGGAAIAALVVILVAVLLRHRYTHDPNVRRVRHRRATREIRRVRKLK